MTKMANITFKGSGLFIKQLRTDRGFRVEIDVSQDQYKEIATIPALPEAIYQVTIEPVIEQL